MTPKQYIDAVERAIGRKLTDKEQRKLARWFLDGVSVTIALERLLGLA